MGGRYNAYPKYEDSEIIWVGEYPENWSLTRVKFEAYVKARVGWHGLKSDDFTEEGPYLVTGSDFKGPRISWDGCYHCDLVRYEQDPYIQLVEGDLLLTKDGTIGKVALVQGLNDQKATLNSGVFVVRPARDNFSTRFYYWLLQSKVFTDFVDYNKTGSTIVHLYQDTFVNFSYAAPTRNEEIKIAKFLDHETAKIDTLIEEQQSLIRLLQEKRQAVISHAVTKGLNPNAPMKDSGVEWLGEVPEHWVVAPLKRFSNILDCKHITAEFVDDGIPLASIREVKDWAVDLSEAKKTTQKFYDLLIDGGRKPVVGDIIYSRNATVGEAALVSGCDTFAMGQDVCLLRANQNFNSEYLLHQLNSPVVKLQLDSLLIGSTFKRINVEDIRNFLIVSPPEIEQVEIKLFLREKAKRYGALIDDAQSQVTLLQERRTALISAAVTGKIDVRDWQAPEQKQKVAV
ncbi:restriction endonuclease subunit S [Endozoicomonas euniceicola]|uniref:Restriction endonuclease subunit S n=1 Tax=Endozoicomonas euniceicola TaxID=1234143 RepID=A0ABY6GPR3_9GAMM|nr:restriction endonuclease subunit S [Endozoicomonas euniceicola]UYM14056.1 restriction endonuclease subunit S [Endozoicomonas euniceicola]